MLEANNVPEQEISLFPFIEVDPYKKAPFCVDGRLGKVDNKSYGPYPQMLGGSLMPVVLEWLINRPEEDLRVVLPQVFERLQEEGYPLGVHTSNHAKEGKSDCGFADNLGKILNTFKEKESEIRKIIKNAGVNFDEEVWQRVVNRLNNIDFNNVPTGDKLIEEGKNNGAVLQVLEGEHQEMAAIVNLTSNTTLDVDRNQEHQAFNLDLWLVREIAKKFNWEDNLVDALSLGLYVATEMVLVEGKGKARLPILINRCLRKKNQGKQ